MKNLIRVKEIVFYVLIPILLGCQGEKKNVADTSIVTTNTIKTEELISFEKELSDTELFKDFSLIMLETNTESLFNRISRICISNKHIFIFDDRLDAILIFNDSGKFINKIHNLGEGPEEYLSIIDFCLDETNNELLILCDRPYKLMRFSLTGQFIDQTPYSELYAEISIVDDHLYCTLQSQRTKYELGEFDLNFLIKNKGLLSRARINGNCRSLGRNLVKSQNLIYTRFFDSSLYFLYNNKIEKKYEFDFGKYKGPIEVAYEEDCIKIFEICRENKYIYSMTNVVESEKYIIFNTNLGICLYEKKTNKLTGYRMLKNTTLNSGGEIYYPNQGDGNSIITIFQPSDLQFYDDESIKKNRILSDMAKKVKEDDNPILVVYHFE